MIDSITKHSLLWNLDAEVKELKACYNACTAVGRCTWFPIKLLLVALYITVGAAVILIVELSDKLLYVPVSKVLNCVTKGVHGIFFK
jgi:hypothetical protein